ncbi:hypothetical protein GCM10023081_06710 [Arthrobacter ginkgonis]|uniref:THIF-type NAD/FAD binding fold domain-containing protein n=1 Tax=Arthrobacter ginkgonis TaxID=1630594 RepID=A0ABP7BX21_9MICC
MRINPGYRVISLADGRVRIGSGAGGLWIEGLCPAEVDFVLSLAGPAAGPTAGPVESAGSAAHSGAAPASGGGASAGEGLDPCRTAAILDLLRPVLVDQATYRIPGSRSGVLAPDIRQWSAAYGRHAGPLVVRRARATVRIHGLDRAGQELARLLASAGIGSLQLCDPEPVGLGDLSTGLLKVPDLGRSRAGACAIHLRRLAPHLRVQELRVREWTRRPASPEPETDVAVVFARERVPAEIQAGFASAQAPHLRVLFGDAGASVGPLVLPGSTACLDCAPDAPDPTDPSPQPPSEPETALAATVAGLAAVQVLMLLDGINVPAAVDGILHLDLATGGVVREAIAPRPDCLCRALAA